MRKRFLLSLLVALLTTISTHAYDLYYIITSDTTVAVTRGDDSVLATVSIPETVTFDGTTYSVTSIGYGAFEECSSLTSITIPNSVTSIGSRAFYGCSSLTSITIPNSVTSIGDYAFADCSSLTSLTLPNSVTSIGEYAFSNCSSLTTIVVESGNTVYDSRENCNAIIETATNTLIAGCQSTTIPNSVTSIGEYAFQSCYSLTSITLPNSVTSIGVGAFSGCSSLTSITIPNSVTSIGNDAFYVCSSLTSITIPNSVTSIGSSAFSGCYSLTSITIPNSVTIIGSCAFYNCSSLTSITIPNSVTSIGNDAFYKCSSLTSITLPNSVTSIGYEAFSYCSSLADIYCYATTPPMCEFNTFYGVSKNCYIHVPAGTVQDYQLATGWSEFIYYYEIEEEEQAIQTAEQDSQPSRKIIRDGRVIILRNGETYDMMGQTL